MTRVVIAATALLLLAACGGPDPLDPPVTSAIESVPVPTGAQVRQDLQRGPDDVAYEVPGTTSAALVAWYERQMPDGSPFGSWAWCDLSAGDTLHGKIYHRPGTSRILGVTIVRGDPPTVLIGHDDSGPC